jgi:hypothetical protein
LIVETPIFFTSSYEEIVEPIGILKTIKEVGALLLSQLALSRLTLMK